MKEAHRDAHTDTSTCCLGFRCASGGGRGLWCECVSVRACDCATNILKPPVGRPQDWFMTELAPRTGHYRLPLLVLVFGFPLGLDSEGVRVDVTPQ